MSYTPPNVNGQATSANSSPVVIASDQSQLATSGDLRFSGGKLFKSGTLNTAGDNIVITPAAGKQITVYWVALIPNSDNTVSNLCKFKFGAAGLPFYTQYAIAHWEPFQGAVDETVIINLTNNQPVSYTIHYTTT